jgi:hypothetical protein
MFRKGGSAGEGITSGLAPRQGYAEPGTVQQNDVSRTMEEMRTAMPNRAPKRNFNDFLINFGLDIASRSPQGNIFQTAAQSAKEPFAQFQTARAGQNAFDDKLALGAYDIVKGEQAAATEQEGKKDLIRLKAELDPTAKKVFREELDVVRVSDYAKSLEENDFDFIANNSMQIANDVVGFKVFKENNPEDAINKKQFIGILPYGYDKKGQAEPNYENISVGQVFYNPEDNFFYERISDEGIIETDFRALDPFTYE